MYFSSNLIIFSCYTILHSLLFQSIALLVIFLKALLLPSLSSSSFFQVFSSLELFSFPLFFSANIEDHSFIVVSPFEHLAFMLVEPSFLTFFVGEPIFLYCTFPFLQILIIFAFILIL